MNAFCFLAILSTTTSHGQQVQENLWVTNGDVLSIVTSPDGNTIYLGGIFTSVGPNTGSSAAIDTSSGMYDAAMPKTDGDIKVVVPDGSGGWYIGGSFSWIGGVSRDGIARIRADKTVDPDFHPNANGQTLSIAVSGSKVYVAGTFTSIGGQSRTYLAALDVATGAATAWNPNPNFVPLEIAVSGATVFAGGQFTSIGGQSRNRLAALDTVTGAATSWNPGANGDVFSLAVSGSTVYAGGAFSSVGGQPRPHIVAIDVTTGIPSSWNPVANNSVLALAVSGSTLYAGGGFTSIGGQSRNYIAALDITSGAATAWNPDAEDYVKSLIISGSTIFAGGGFAAIGGQSRNHIAALDATSGAATTWNPHIDNPVFTLAHAGSTIYAGGTFTSVNGQARNSIAALDASTGLATSWNPNTDGGIYGLAVSGSTVYAGGWFTSIGGQMRNYIAGLDASTGLATSWNPDASGDVYALAVSGSTVYAGGWFTSIGGQTRNNIAALDTSTGLATSWNPNADDYVWSLTTAGSTLYAVGGFTNIGGQSRNTIAALDATTGLATSWNPGTSGEVYALAVSGSTVYAGGYFTNIGGQMRNYIAALDASTGAASSWNPNANTFISSLAVTGSTIYAGGSFTSIGGQSRNYVAALDATSGTATTWDPNPNSFVNTLAMKGTNLYVGGNFGNIMNQPRSRFAGFTISCSLPDVPTVSASTTTVCFGDSSQLSITSGNLNDATYWQWYSNSCGGTPIGTGTSVTVSPLVTTTYYARGEGGCVIGGSCGSVTVMISPVVFSPNPATLDFGSAVVGQPTVDSVIVTNTGAAPLTINSVTSSNPVFTILPLSAGPIAPSGTQSFHITFTPTGLGEATANIIFTHDGFCTTDTVTVSGIGVTPGFSLDKSDLDFGEVVAGSSATDSVEVTNTGTSPLTISSISSDNADFSVDPPSAGPISPSGTQKFLITFTPSGIGVKNAALIFVHDADASPDTVDATGTGIQGEFSADPASIDFGTVTVGSFALDSIEVSNVGTSPLTVSAAGPDPQFAVVPNGPLVINPGESFTFFVTFAPASAGEKLGNILFTHDGSSSPDSLEVEGFGAELNTALFLSLTPDSIIAKDPVKGKLLKPVKRFKNLYPNWANLIDETVAQGGFEPETDESDEAGGMVIGVSSMQEISTNKWRPVKDSAAIRGWVRLTKWDFANQKGKGFAAIQKTLEDKSGSHTGGPRGFDVFAGGKPFVNQQKKLPPKKQSNKLFAELVALKLNIMVSELGKTPAGFGDLIYTNETSPYDGLTILEIADEADMVMTYWQGVIQSDYDHLYDVVRAINGAFVGPLDTVSFNAGPKLVLHGKVALGSVPFLTMPAVFVPTRITPRSSATESGDDEEFDDEEFEDGLSPVAAKLYQNYPNPFNPSTTIAFRLKEASNVSIRIYNVLGQEVATLINNEEYDEGLNMVDFAAGELSSGIYFYQIHADGLEDDGLRTMAVKKMVLLK